MERLASICVCDTVRMNAAAFGSLPASACTLGTQGSLGPDRITYNTYDADNQLLSIQKAYGTSLQQTYAAYSYSPNGKQTSVTDADGNYATMTYDGFDRLSVWTFPSMTTHGQVNSADYEQYGYDAEDNRTSLRKRDGRAFTFTYDARNRVITKAVPAGCAPIQAGPCPPASATRSIYYGYDIRNLQLYARFDSASGDGVTNAYDGFGRLTSSTTSIGGLGGAISSTYDADGNRTQVLHPDGAHFDSTFDAADRFQYANATPAGSTSGFRLLTYAYDALGRPTTMNPASSLRTNAYDPVSRLSSLSWAFAGGAGNVAYTLGYNPASQIVSDQHSNSAFVWQGAVAGTTSYAVNGLNQYTSVGAAAFGYDADGDLISDGHSTYGYDAENRLISATGAANATLTYDPLGRLWQTTGPSTGTTTFLHDGDQIAIEYNGAGALLRRYMWGPGVDSPAVWDEGGALNCTGTHALSADRQGSIVATADCYGNQQAINTYDPYGAPAAGNVGRFQYTGQAWIPELGMYYYKARIYAPTLGRFMQTDPVGYKDQVNLYAYVGNDPVNSNDPSGRGASDWWDIEAKYQRGFAIAQEELRKWQGHHNDAGDAMRHAEWSYRMTKDVGAPMATLFGIFHEVTGTLQGQPFSEATMDMHNNTVGVADAEAGVPINQANLLTSPPASLNSYNEFANSKLNGGSSSHALNAAAESKGYDSIKLNNNGTVTGTRMPIGSRIPQNITCDSRGDCHGG